MNKSNLTICGVEIDGIKGEWLVENYSDFFDLNGLSNKIISITDLTSLGNVLKNFIYELKNETFRNIIDKKLSKITIDIVEK